MKIVHDANAVAANDDRVDRAENDDKTRLAEQSRELKRLHARLDRYETALRAANVTVYSQDYELRYTAISNPMLGRSIDEIIGLKEEDVLPAESAGPVIALKREALDSGIAKSGEVSIQLETGLRWFDLHIEPLRDDKGGICGLTCAAVDITQRKEGEAHLRLLMRELTHRSKNLLAVIQAMARQTARHAGSVGGFLDRFGARLQALAASHDLLVKGSWHGASLEEVVRSQLGHHLASAVTPVTIQGPPIELKPEAAQSLGLALHELAVNAAKYGALSVSEGRVSIVWRRMPAAEGHGLEILWNEEGGPLAKTPRKRGFGSLVIERNLVRTLDAEVELTFPKEGVHCRIVMPLTQMLAAR